MKILSVDRLSVMFFSCWYPVEVTLYHILSISQEDSQKSRWEGSCNILPLSGRERSTTPYILMKSSFSFDTMYLGRSIVYIVESQVIFSK